MHPPDPETRNPAAANGRADRNKKAKSSEAKQYNKRPSAAMLRLLRTEIAMRYSWRAERQQGERRPSPMQNVRMRDLERLFQHRYGEHLPDDDAGTDDLEIAAHHIFHFPGGTFEQRLRSWSRLWAPWADEAILSRLAAKVSRGPLKWKADTLATWLRLTYADRTLLKITTIGAIGFGMEDRLKRRKEAARDRQRIRRRKARAINREEYEAASDARNRPWVATGMSRRTWYRKGKPRLMGKSPLAQVHPHQIDATIAENGPVPNRSAVFPPAPDWPAAASGSWIAGQSGSVDALQRRESFTSIK